MFSKQTAEEKPDAFGLAFPGGSYTAAVINAGIMRGFQQKKVTIDGEERPAMERFDYVSAISGGNVPSVQFAFAQGTTSDELLDTDGINNPTEITYEDLDEVSEKSLFYSYTQSVVPSLARALIMSLIFGENFFAKVMYFSALEPFQIKAGVSIPPIRDDVSYTPLVNTAMVAPYETFPYWMYERMNVAFSQSLAKTTNVMQLTTFVTTFAPLYAFDNSLVWESAKESGHQIPIPAYITPDEFHIAYDLAELEFDPVGNVTTDPATLAPFSLPLNEVQAMKDTFTVERMLGHGTNLVSILAPIISYLIPTIPQDLIALMNEPLTQHIPMANGETREMAFTDGGLTDANGIPALLDKKVNKIIMPVYGTGGPEVTEGIGPVLATLGTILPYFGLILPESVGIEYEGGPFSFLSGFSWSSQWVRKVFDPMSNGENQIEILAEKLQSLYDAGQPLVASLENLAVVENKFFGVEGGAVVDLVIIGVWDVPVKFSEQVDPSVAPPPEGRNFTEHGYFTNEELSWVPRLLSTGKTGYIDFDFPLLNFTYNTQLPFMELKVETRECKMTEILTSWIVKESWDGLTGADGEVKFAGFNNFFEEKSMSKKVSILVCFQLFLTVNLTTSWFSVCLLFIPHSVCTKATKKSKKGRF